MKINWIKRNHNIKRLNQSTGLTLVEVLVSTVFILFLALASTQTIISGQFLSSSARHKIQAMYAAQQIIEQQRRKTFVASNSTTTAPVTLDPSTNFMGTSKITVSNLDASHNQVQVEIDWLEQALMSKITLKEYYSTNITNSSIPN